MLAFGIAFIGNVWAVTMFGTGLLLRGYSGQLLANETFAGLIPRSALMAVYIPHGVMIGTGLVALIQVGILLFRTGDTSREDTILGAVSEREIRRALGLGTIAFMAISAALALVDGLASEMSLGMLALFVLYAAFAAYVRELIVGIAAMHSG